MNFRHFMLVPAVAPRAADFVAASDVVVIDHDGPVFAANAGFPPERAEELRRSMEGQLGHRVPFAEFAGNPAKYISARLVRKYPGTPFGVTWNGGMAFTRNDCAAAKKAFDAFRTAGEFVKPPPERDPVAPANHLGPLLGW